MNKLNKYSLRILIIAKNILLTPVYCFIYFFKRYYLIYSSVKNYKEFEARRDYPNFIQIEDAKEHISYLAEIYCVGKGIDIGGGINPLKNARNIEDNFEENAYKINEREDSLDFVFSSHCLEHLKRPFKSLAEIKRVLKKEGILFLYLPHPATKIWKKQFLKFHKWQPTPKKLLRMMRYLKFEIVAYSFAPDGYQSFYLIVKKK
jgi:SAM-dependent methyltransferase